MDSVRLQGNLSRVFGEMEERSSSRCHISSGAVFSDKAIRRCGKVFSHKRHIQHKLFFCSFCASLWLSVKLPKNVWDQDSAYRGGAFTGGAFFDVVQE